MLMQILENNLCLSSIATKIWNGKLSESLSENKNPIKINVSTIGRIVR
jgi:hypothetical protein